MNGLADGAVPVVAAVVLRDDHLLLCQRGGGAHLPHLWEFPGGKIDAGETPEEALARELDEELGVAAAVGGLVAEVRHRYPEKRVWIRFYATAIRGCPEARVHVAVRWVPLTELGDLQVPPANAPVVARIRRFGASAVPAVPGHGAAREP